MHSLLESNPRKPDATLHLWNRARKIPKIGQKWHYQDDRCNIIHAVGIFISHHPISQYFITLCMIIHWADWGQTIIACLWVASWCSWHRRTLHELFLFEPFGKPSLSKSSIQTVSIFSLTPEGQHSFCRGAIPNSPQRISSQGAMNFHPRLSSCAEKLQTFRLRTVWSLSFQAAFLELPEAVQNDSKSGEMNQKWKQS